MELKDRIENIKKLLRYCPHSNRDVVLVDDRIGLFFAGLINNKDDDRFTHTGYERIYPRITLTSQLNKDHETHSYAIAMEYVYDDGRDGEYTEMIWFNDEDLEDSIFLSDYEYMVDYSEVPDDMWAVIQDMLYKKVAENNIRELEKARESVVYWERMMKEFNESLDLKE